MKKVFSFIFILCFSIATVANAEDLGDLFYSNSTGANVWTSPTGQKYLYGGNFEFRFKNPGNTYPLWFNAQPPAYQIGCNGLSLRGGFLSLLGLDDIKNQLSNAGAQFAWGIMVGLVYSMPGIKDVFMSIQKWARTIQKLLQNSCRIGQMFAKKTGMSEAIKPVFDSVNNSFGDLKNITGNIDALFNQIDTYVDNNFKDDSKPPASNQPKNIIHLNKMSVGVSLFASYFGEYFPIYGNKKDYLFKGKISDVFNKKLGDLTLNVSNNDLFNKKILLYKLAVLMYGDLRANNEAKIKLEQLFNDNGEINADYLKSLLKSIATGSIQNTTISEEYYPPVLNPKDAADALINGFGSVNSPNCNKSTNTCSIPDFYVDYLVLPNSTTSEDKNTNRWEDSSRALVIYNSAGGIINVKWNGLYNESLKAIREAVKEEVKNPSYKFVTADNIPDGDVYKSAVLFIPGIKKYIDLIALLEKKYGRNENSYTYSLKVTLAKLNAYLGALQIGEYLEGAIVQLMSDRNREITPQDREAISEYLNRIKAVNREIKNDIKDYYDENQQKIYQIIQMFGSIETQLKEEIESNTGLR